MFCCIEILAMILMGNTMQHALTNKTKNDTLQGESQLAPLSKQQRPLFLHGIEGQHTLSVGVGIAISNHALGIQRHQTVARLQATYGNRAVLRKLYTSPHVARMPALRPSQGMLFQRKCACGGSSESVGECAEYKSKREGALQQRIANQGV